jgi:hypothetical protein
VHARVLAARSLNSSALIHSNDRTYVQRGGGEPPFPHLMSVNSPVSHGAIRDSEVDGMSTTTHRGCCAALPPETAA